jgi:hypothetical protein
MASIHKEILIEAAPEIRLRVERGAAVMKQALEEGARPG